MIQIRDGMKIVFIGDSIIDVKFNKNFRRNLKGAKSYPLNVRIELEKRGFHVICFSKESQTTELITFTTD